MRSTRRGFLIAPALALWPRRTASLTLPVPAPVTRLLFGGDVMLARHVGEFADARHDPEWPLRRIAPLLSNADIAFVNLESPFCDHPHKFEGMVFQAAGPMVRTLLTAGVVIVSTANHHTRDCGTRGIDFTLDLLAENGIVAVGTGKTAEMAHRGAVLERNGVRFGFLAYTFDQANGNYRDRDDRIAMMAEKQLTRDIQELRKRADVAIVSMHAGWEYMRQVNPLQRSFAHAAIDAGATLVVGHHPHVTQPIETYAGGLIFYSLGNLVFDQVDRIETQRGWLADVRFLGQRLAGYSVIPTDIVNFQPAIDEPRNRRPRVPSR